MKRKNLTEALGGMFPGITAQLPTMLAYSGNSAQRRNGWRRDLLAIEAKCRAAGIGTSDGTGKSVVYIAVGHVAK
jgi:hypothetical protein